MDILSSFRDAFRAMSRNAWLYLISNSMQAVTAGAVVVLYTLYLSALGYDERFIGLLLFVGIIGSGLGILPSQPLVNRFGWRTMLIWSDLIGGVAIFFQLIAPTPAMLLVTSVAVGASVAIVFIINAPFLAANTASSDRTTLFGLNNALQFLASLIGAILGGWLPAVFAHISFGHAPLLATNPEARSYQLALLVLGALSVPSIIPIFLLSETKRAPAGQADFAVLWGAHHWRDRWHKVRIKARNTARGVVGRFSLFQVLLGFGAGLWSPYFNIYVVKHLGLSTFWYGILWATATVMLAFASLISAPLVWRFGKVRVIVISHLCALPFLLLMGAIPALAVVIPAYLIRMTLANTSGPALQSILMEEVAERDRVLANGVYNVSWQVAWAIGAGAGGLIIGWLGRQAPMILAVPWYGAAALVFTWFFWRRGSVPLSKPQPNPQQDTPAPERAYSSSD